MLPGGNKLRLKIRKKSTNATIKADENSNAAVNRNVAAPRKRCNPFSQEEVLHKAPKCDTGAPAERSMLFNKLDSVQPSDWSVDRTANIINDRNKDGSDCVEIDEEHKDVHEWKYNSPCLPLDWSVKQKVQFISKDPLTFCANIKSGDKVAGIKKFACNDNENPTFCQYLCCWIYPLIPGIRNFPLKKKSTDKFSLGTKETDVTVSIGANKTFQNALLQQWKISFQSLFNMLKLNLCPYFYVCSHQFSVLFKAAGISCNTTKVIVTPTTKGLRAMLADEDISYVFTNQDKCDTSSMNADAEEEIKTDSVDSEYDADVFINSLGLRKDTHFPTIEEDKKLATKSELMRLDYRPESTVEINDVQAFFNFLLNSMLLCAPSGGMAGVPPTLLSPVVFDGAACHSNKYHIGKIKQTTKISETFLHCLDIYGYILPTSLKGVVDLQRAQCEEFKIRAKTYENLAAFNMRTPDSQCVVDANEYLNQSCTSIPDQSEVEYKDKMFRFR